ncbi:MAG: S8 family serine peptidase [Thaumarchaeota archaeon]|nr:S8 family serine peptidase [Nitrososphaerota archaeon]
MEKKGVSIQIGIIIPILFVLLLIPAIQAQELEQEEEILFGSGDMMMETPISELFSIAEEQGTVKVIVSLDVSFTPEGFFDAASIEEQRGSIQSAQQALIGELSSFLGPIESVPYSFKYIPSIAMTIDVATLEFLQASPRVRSVTEDIAVFPALALSIPVIGADKAWDLGFSGQGQTVAVLDTGVESSHTMLSGKVVDEACYSTTSSPNSSTLLCPNGSNQQIGPGAAAPCAGICSHGTHVAGIAAGGEFFSGPVKYEGVAKDSNVIAIQVFSKFEGRAQCDPFGIGWPDPCVKSYRSDQMKGLERVYDLRNTYDISSVNLSLGGGKYFSSCDTVSSAYKNIVDQLRSVNIPSIIASGNDGYTDAISFPACISSAISVGGTDNNDVLYVRSNNANFLDLVAPGVSIRSSIPGDNLQYKRGTSMAAPHVAGAWAVMKSADPSASIQDVLNSLKTTGVDVVDTRPGSTGSTYKRIQLDSALCDLDPAICPLRGFDISANPDQLSMSKGGSASSTITVSEFGGFTGTVDLGAVPSSVLDLDTTFSPVQVTIDSTNPSQTSTATVTSIRDSGTYSVEVKGVSGAVQERNSAVIDPIEVGCLIATAAFGSDMAPQVQLLRETRDNVLLETSSGSLFMEGFNAFYYSFSPTVAQWERDSPVFKEMVKATITPLITSLSILNYVDIDSEFEVVGYGMSVILLNISMYFLLPVLAVIRIKRFVKGKFIPNLKQGEY